MVTIEEKTKVATTINTTNNDDDESIDNYNYIEEECVINIVDAICGSGKTSAAINMINRRWEESQGIQKFLYITPYLEEVNRIIKECPDCHFCQPYPVQGSKLNGIKKIFEEGRNVVSTHSLFETFDEDVAELIRMQGYTLIMDEVADVVQQMDISKSDLENIMSNYCEVREEDNQIQWVHEYGGGRLSDYKRQIDLGAVYYFSSTALIYTFPVECFRAFEKGQIYILTYMFDAQIQKYYYDMYGIQYKYLDVKRSHTNNNTTTNNGGNEEWSAKDYYFVECSEGRPRPSLEMEKENGVVSYGSLIHILDNDKLNHIGRLDGTLSKSWYTKNRNNGCLKQLKNNLVNFFVNIERSPSQNNLWTCFKDFQEKIRGKGYSKGYLSCNMRATNNYMDRDTLAYPINRYFKPIIKNFFTSKNIVVDEDSYALSELLQWIFRSAIRKGKPITIYVPSLRMRKLLEDWCKEN